MGKNLEAVMIEVLEAGAKEMAMTNDQLRARVRDLIASGELPSERPVIYGTGVAALGSRSAR